MEISRSSRGDQRTRWRRRRKRRQEALMMGKNLMLVNRSKHTKEVQTTTLSHAMKSRVKFKPKLLLLLLLFLISSGSFHFSSQNNNSNNNTNPNNQASASTIQDFDGATFYKAPVGSRVRIACNASRWWDDSISLVLWFKGAANNGAQPIYTIDARQRPLSSGQARHLVADAYKGRAKFVVPSGAGGRLSPSSPPPPPGSNAHQVNQSGGAPYLEVAPLLASDQAEYRCRVDYRQRPRENFLIILFVLVPPSSVEIMEPNGRLAGQIYGPLSEGAELTLLCLAKGGRPAPQITWRRNGRVIDESYLTLNDFLALQLAGGQSGGGGGELKSPPSSRLQRRGAADKNRNLLDNNQQRVWLLDDVQLNSTQTPSGSPRLASERGHSINSAAAANNRKWAADDDDVAQAARRKEWAAAVANPSQSQSESEQLDGGATSGRHVRELGGEQVESGSLEGVDWRAWPEFSFFQLGPSEFFYRHANKLAPAGNEGGATAAAATQPSRGTNRGGDQATRFKVAAPQQQQEQATLIETQVNETITTAVNVLHVGELTRAHLQIATGSDLVPPLPGGQPQLECHASNLHYDLRALIRMFAPKALQPNRSSSLLGGDSAAKLAVTQPLALANWASEQQAALAESIERALWATLDSLNGAAPADDDDDERQSQLMLESGGGGGQLAASQKQLSAGDNTPAAAGLSDREGRPNGGGGGGATNSSRSKKTGQEANWQALIEQQLIRPHQLASSTAAAAAGQRAPGGELARSTLIALEAYLRPLDVKVSGQQRPLVAGQLVEFQCLSSGSRPPARLSWFKNGALIGGQQLADSIGSDQVMMVINPVIKQHQDSADKTSSHSNGTSTSRSRLSLKLEPSDHLAKLSCRAENVLAIKHNSQQRDTSNETDGWQLEDSITLSVHYPPRVKLELGNRMLSEQIRENQDLFFSCHVDAQPAVQEISWLHNGRLINETNKPQTSGSVASGSLAQETGIVGGGGKLIVSNNSLVLQRVQINQRGQYACMATNSEGVGLSNQIDLRVLHAPICVSPVEFSGGGGKLPALVASDRSNNKLNELDIAQFATNRAPLHLGTRAMPLNGRSKFKCHMLAEPADESLEFVWYLNNSFNERRPLQAASSHRMGQTSRFVPGDKRDNLIDIDARADFETMQAGNLDSSSERAVGSNKVASSELTFSPSSSSDYGQLYCVARNSLGTAKRACVYTIAGSGLQTAESGTREEEEDDDDDDEALAACLAVNVTSQTAWIGCDARLDQNNEQNATRRYKFNVLVFSVESSTSSPGDEDANENVELTELDPAQSGANQAKRPVANLSSASMDEPLFALVNLRPATNYLLEIELVNESEHLQQQNNFERARKPIRVRLTTKSHGELPIGEASPLKPLVANLVKLTGSNDSEAQSSQQQQQQPTIRQVTEPHRADLVASALISTRSTSGFENSNSRDNNNNKQQLQQQQQQQLRGRALKSGAASGRLLQATRQLDQYEQANASGGGSSWWRQVTSSLAELVRQQAPTPPGGGQSLIKWPDALALSALISGLAITLIGLLVLRKRRQRQSQADAPLDNCEVEEEEEGEFDMKMSCLSGISGSGQCASHSPHPPPPPSPPPLDSLRRVSEQHCNLAAPCVPDARLASGAVDALAPSMWPADCSSGTWTRHQLANLNRAYSTLEAAGRRQQQQQSPLPQTINFLQPSVLSQRSRAAAADANQLGQQQQWHQLALSHTQNGTLATRSRSATRLAADEMAGHVGLSASGEPAGAKTTNKLQQQQQRPWRAQRLTQSSEPGRGLISDANFLLESSELNPLESPYGLATCSCEASNASDSGRLTLILSQQALSDDFLHDELAWPFEQQQQQQQVDFIELVPAAMMLKDALVSPPLSLATNATLSTNTANDSDQLNTNTSQNANG